jgi:hypothetical protein
MDSGFCRLMSRRPDTGGLAATYEVLVERPSGCRLVFEDISRSLVDARRPGVQPTRP